MYAAFDLYKAGSQIQALINVDFFKKFVFNKLFQSFSIQIYIVEEFVRNILRYNGMQNVDKDSSGFQ